MITYKDLLRYDKAAMLFALCCDIKYVSIDEKNIIKNFAHYATWSIDAGVEAHPSAFMETKVLQKFLPELSPQLFYSIIRNQVLDMQIKTEKEDNLREWLRKKL